MTANIPAPQMFSVNRYGFLALFCNVRMVPAPYFRLMTFLLSANRSVVRDALMPPFAPVRSAQFQYQRASFQAILPRAMAASEKSMSSAMVQTARRSAARGL